VFLTLEPIPEKRRRAEAELWAAFEAERPRILGVLLDAVVEGLRRLPETRLEKLPRMADFDSPCHTIKVLLTWCAKSFNNCLFAHSVVYANQLGTTHNLL
jgi:hypothetical protein